MRKTKSLSVPIGMSDELEAKATHKKGAGQDEDCGK